MYLLYMYFTYISTHVIHRVELVTFGISVMILKSQEWSLTISVSLTIYSCYFTNKADDGNTFKGHLVNQWPLPFEQVEEKISTFDTPCSIAFVHRPSSPAGSCFY